MLDNWIARWIRADAAALSAVTLWAVSATHSSWMWFFALFLVPDLSMIGYVFGPRVGAVSYNAAHMIAWPVGLFAAGLALQSAFATTAGLSWTAHIAIDQAVGYGLKMPNGFEYTALGPIGRARARSAR